MSDDLISRQAAIDAIADYLSKTTYTSSISHLNTGALILAKVPSAQPELIRCKDCKYRYIKNDVWTCPFGLPSGPDGYCSYGERKES